MTLGQVVAVLMGIPGQYEFDGHVLHCRYEETSAKTTKPSAWLVPLVKLVGAVPHIAFQVVNWVATFPTPLISYEAPEPERYEESLAATPPLYPPPPPLIWMLQPPPPNPPLYVDATQAFPELTSKNAVPPDLELSLAPDWRNPPPPEA